MTLPKDPQQKPQPVNSTNESTAEVTIGSLITGIALLTAQHYGVTPDDLSTGAGVVAALVAAVGGASHYVRRMRKKL